MRNSRDKWTFFQHPSKRVLSSSELTYLKNALRKILKIGVELEFNLPDSKGTCKGNSKTCPCVKMLTDECWKKCVNFEECSKIPNFSRCANRTDECDPKDCKNCSKYKLLCDSLFCSDFMSSCYGCKDFSVNCDNCKDKYDPKRNPDNIRRDISSELNPTNSYGTINKTGVHSITTDGSLLGNHGVEIITVGRRIDYWEFFKMADKIINSAIGRGGYMNERCSTHMHVLSSYYGKLAPENSGVPAQINELEKDIPEIVLANFHQLCRRYQNAVTWMTMALNEMNQLTRWEKFRVSVLDISAILNSMKNVASMVHRNSSNNKYGWVNYDNVIFSERNEDVKRLHIEMRVADGLVSPSAVAAIACMYYAMIIKAVEISRYGVVEVGNKEWMTRAQEIKSCLMNNLSDYNAGNRFSDTSNLKNYFSDLREESYELISQIKHILMPIGPAFQVLEKLAATPIALRRANGDSWSKVEDDLRVETTEEDEFSIKINELIDLRIIMDCENENEWIGTIAKMLHQEPEFTEMKISELRDRVESYIGFKRNEGEMIWSDTLGSMTML